MTDGDRQARLRIDEELQGPGPPAGPLDVSDLLGTWVNTDQHVTGRVLRMVVSEREGELRVRAFGVGDTESRDWNEVAATALARTVADRHAWGFWCRFELDSITTDVAAYFNQGIVVIGTYNSFGEASSRSDYWKREFFHREDPQAPPPANDAAKAADFSYAHDRFEGGRPVSPSIDLEPLLGAWVGFTDGLTGLTGVDLDGEDGNVRVRARGSGSAEPPDWGAAPARVFADDVGRREAFAFRARYEHGFQDVEIFGYLNRRVLIAELATAFADGDRRLPYFTRTFYYRR
ncbi:MAG: hypothetical protein EXQ70_05895 [Solirubrobacterales bacterium]|nr:hypothetical protein [Solirubrobacterales bacterium]